MVRHDSVSTELRVLQARGSEAPQPLGMLLERTAELRALDEAMASAEMFGGRVLVIEGAAGFEDAALRLRGDSRARTRVSRIACSGRRA
jgi:hypothetical protein